MEDYVSMMRATKSALSRWGTDKKTGRCEGGYPGYGWERFSGKAVRDSDCVFDAASHPDYTQREIRACA